MSMQMIFITSSVFQKVKNHFPACGEKCLKQDAFVYYQVMVIVRKADFYNKYKARISELSELGNRAFICFRRYAPYDHDLYISFVSVLQVLFGACIRESDLTLRKTRGYNESAWTDGISKVHLLRQLRAAYIQSLSQYNFDEMQQKDCSCTLPKRRKRCRVIL